MAEGCLEILLLILNLSVFIISCCFFNLSNWKPKVANSPSFYNNLGGDHKMPMGLCLAVVGGVLGSLQFGYHSGVINAPETSIKQFMNGSKFDRDDEPMSHDEITSLFAVIVAIFAVGGCIGGFAAGWWADKFGRRKGLILNTAIGLLPSVLMFFSRHADSYEMLIVGRLLVGFCCGLYTGLTPLYLSEISTPQIRGALGVLHQLGVVSGLLLSQVLGFQELLGNSQHWNLLLGLGFPLCIVQLLALKFSPESPRFLLITQNKEQEAVKALHSLRGQANVRVDMEEMKKEAAMEVDTEKVSMGKLLTSPVYRRPLVICVVMQLSQQLSGINGIFYYSASLFGEAGLSKETAVHATSGVGVVMVVMTIITIPLMDRAGRRSLHLLGLSGMLVFSILITITLTFRHSVGWFDILSICVSLIYVLFFALGPGSIPWLLVAELFSQAPRPAAMSVSVLVNWLSNFVVGFTFPHLQSSLGNYTFIPFSCLLFLFVIFTFFFLPETKNRTFEEVAKMWVKDGGAKDNGRNGTMDESKSMIVKGHEEIASI